MNALVRLPGIQASTLHPYGCDLCKYDDALLYDLMVTFLKTLRHHGITSLATSCPCYKHIQHDGAVTSS